MSTNTLEIMTLGGRKYSLSALVRLLPTVEIALFFAKLMELSAAECGLLLKKVFDKSTLVAELTGGVHSTSLQDYLTSVGDFIPDLVQGGVEVVTDPYGSNTSLDESVLAQLFESAHIYIAQSIRDVANKTHVLLEGMPTGAAEMHFKTMMKFNAQTGKMGTYSPTFVRPTALNNLVVLDVSASVSESTVGQIIDDVVGLAVKAQATLAIVSNSTTWWAPGTYSTQSVLCAAEYGGTYYETLLPLFHRDWGEVVSIADYDSSASVLTRFQAEASGSIERVLDVSLVNRPTFLGECLSTIAKSSEVMLLADSDMSF